MKLSEAIIAGCKLRPRKAYRRMVLGERGACALGAAAVGAGVWPIDDVDPLRARFGSLDMLAGATVPWGPGESRLTLWQLIGDLNDEYPVTREEIAEFVAWLEDGGAI